MKKVIYLDNASNTPLDKKVLLKMRPYLKESFVGNSHSLHPYGIKALVAIENARQQIAQASGVSTKEIFFTSGATESNNWVLQSLVMHELFAEKKPKLHAVVSAIEHSSVLKTCKQLEQMGMHITYIQPDKRGVITTRDIRSALKYNTLFVCVMAVNNETGVQNPINAIGKIARANKSFMISDCTQLLTYGGKYCNLKAQFPYVDYFTFSGHKIYGPTGIGCLIARSRVPVYPFIIGGGQEQGKRGGTTNTAGIVGLGEAYRRISQTDYEPFFRSMYDYLIHKLETCGVPFSLNSIPDHKNIVSLNFSGFMHDTELASLLSMYDIACSAGAACEASTNNTIESVPSHVLLAMHKAPEEINNSVRVSFSKYTTHKDIDKFCSVMVQLYQNSQKESK